MENKKIYTTTYTVVVEKEGGRTGVEVKKDGDKLSGFGLEVFINELMSGKTIDRVTLKR